MEMSNDVIGTVGVLGTAPIAARVVEALAAAGHRVVSLAGDETRLDHLAPADLVIEAVPDEPEAKQAAMIAIAGVVSHATPIATTTSVLSVTELAATVPHPERVAGLHLVDLLPDGRTVEIVRALKSDETVIDRLAALVDTLAGKQAVVVGDRPGFLVDALQRPYLNDVIQAYDEELASAEDIDVAIRLGLGYSTGPLELLDAIGLDEHLRVTEALYAATKDARYAPPPLLRRMVAAGRLGDSQGFRATAPITS